MTETPARSFTSLEARGSGTARATGAHFAVELHHGETEPVIVASADETILLLTAVAATIDGTAPACAAPARSVCILPPGRHLVRRAAPGPCVVLRGDPDAVTEPIADDATGRRDPWLVLPVPHRRLRAAGQVVVHAVDELPVTGSGSRMRMLQSSRLSLNWVEYDGPRDRSALSPHAHRDFEQGSLALQGRFVHHLRVPWGPDAGQWREDEHLEAGSPSLLVIPAGTEHTTEGVGEEPHLLIDLFSPPRADFIARGMVANSADYAAAYAEGAS